MPKYVGDGPPDTRVISVTRGCDRSFTVQRVNTDGDTIDWDSELSIIIDVPSKDAPTVLPATVSAESAIIVIPLAVCDLVTNRTAWRIIMHTNSYFPVMVGGFERHDGGKV